METQTQTQPEYLRQFLCMYAVIYLIARYVVFRNWSPEIRPEASSCLISLAHGTPAVILAIQSLTQSQTLTLTFSSPNTPLQNVALDYSVAYFLADITHLIFFSPTLDFLFIAHHIATLFVFLTCRHAVAHGGAGILALLVLAEVTSFCQNVWTLAGARRKEVPIADRIHRILSPPFFVVYTVARGIAGPYLLYRMAAFYSAGEADGVIPRWVWLSWIAVVSAAISVSILWIGNLWVLFFHERRAKLQKQS